MAPAGRCPEACVQGFGGSQRRLNGRYPRIDVDGNFKQWLSTERDVSLVKVESNRWEFFDVSASGTRVSLAVEDGGGVVRGSDSELPVDEYFLTEDGEYSVRFSCCSDSPAATPTPASAEGNGRTGVFSTQTLIIIAAVFVSVVFFFLASCTVYRRVFRPKSAGSTVTSVAAAPKSPAPASSKRPALPASAVPSRGAPSTAGDEKPLGKKKKRRQKGDDGLSDAEAAVRSGGLAQEKAAGTAGTPAAVLDLLPGSLPFSAAAAAAGRAPGAAYFGGKAGDSPASRSESPVQRRGRRNCMTGRTLRSLSDGSPSTRNVRDGSPNDLVVMEEGLSGPWGQWSSPAIRLSRPRSATSQHSQKASLSQYTLEEAEELRLVARVAEPDLLLESTLLPLGLSPPKLRLKEPPAAWRESSFKRGGGGGRWAHVQPGTEDRWRPKTTASMASKKSNDHHISEVADELGRSSMSSAKGRFEGPLTDWTMEDPADGLDLIALPSGINEAEAEDYDAVSFGDRVRVRGLMEATWNDAEGIAEDFDALSGRWQVRLHDGRCKEVHYQNLESAMRPPTRNRRRPKIVEEEPVEYDASRPPSRPSSMQKPWRRLSAEAAVAARPNTASLEYVPTLPGPVKAIRVLEEEPGLEISPSGSSRSAEDGSARRRGEASPAVRSGHRSSSKLVRKSSMAISR